MNWHELWKVSRTGCKEVQSLIPPRGVLQIPSALVAVLLFALHAQAQTQIQPQQARNGDWQAVKYLAPRTRISVKAQHNYRCWVEDVTDDELICGTRTPFQAVTLAIRRSEIHEIRVAPTLTRLRTLGLERG